MPDDTLWPLDPHTAGKHQLLVEYLKAWFPIMASTEKKVVFLDAFAGPGHYSTGEYGSPIRAIETLLDHTGFPGWSSTEFVFSFIEERHDRAIELQATIDQFAEERGGLPPNVKPVVYEMAFIDRAHEFLDGLEPGHRLAPALAFIDPFGFSGVPLATITEFLRWPKCEVLFNFMFDPVNRFATGDLDEENEGHFDALFGCTGYRDAPPSGDPGRRNFLVNLYEHQLETVGGFSYVRSIEMVTKRNRTGYFLIFGTRDPLGLEKFKDAMWKIDPEEGSRFTPATEQITFDLGVDVSELRARLSAQFQGRSATIEEVERFTLVNTRFRHNGHLKTKTLRPMERDGEITDVQVVADARHGRSYPPGSKITFR